MKLLSKFPRVSLYYGVSMDYPFLLLDAYRHSFTFVTIENPRVESGVTFVAALLKFQIRVAFYIDRPYQVRSEFMKRWRERMHAKKE